MEVNFGMETKFAWLALISVTLHDNENKTQLNIQ